jgi:putative hydrolase of the HAD superfamily
MLPDPRDITSIVFDLDGTLYVCPQVGRDIEAAAEALVARRRGLTLDAGRELVRRARQRLAEDLDEAPTLTRTCLELGIELADLHEAFRQQIHPERYLAPDPVLRALLESLGEHCDLYIYTNNNLSLARKILALLGVEKCFAGLYTIEFSGSPKPDVEALQRVVADIGATPDTVLFVGDRDAVDLAPARRQGMATLLVQDPAELLQVHRLLGLIP